MRSAVTSAGDRDTTGVRDAIVGGEFMDVPNSNCRWLGGSNRVVRCRNRRHSQKLFEPGRREDEKIMVLDVAGVT